MMNFRRGNYTKSEGIGESNLHLTLPRVVLQKRYHVGLYNVSEAMCVGLYNVSEAMCIEFSLVPFSNPLIIGDATTMIQG